MRQQTSTGSIVAAIVLTVVATVAVVFAGGYAYLRYGHPPVAVTDAPFPNEKRITHIPLNARIDRETQPSPLQVTPANLQEGARVYMAQCATCHGTPNHESALEHAMYPMVPQLWKGHGHGHGVVGVSDDPVGESYWKVANGIRLAGMPSFQKILSNNEMWQVSLLVAQADKPQLPEVQQVLNGPLEPTGAQSTAQLLNDRQGKQTPGTRP